MEWGIKFYYWYINISSVLYDTDDNVSNDGNENDDNGKLLL